MLNKSSSAFKTIAEVATELGVVPHVLRFWETKFKEISPMKTNTKRRYYRPDDVEVIKLIKEFLYDKRYTIEGVQKIFKEHGVKAFLNGDVQKDFFEDMPRSSEVAESADTSQAAVKAFKISDTQSEQLIALKNELLSIANDLKSAL